MVLSTVLALLILLVGAGYASAAPLIGLNNTRDITPPVISNVKVMQICGAGNCGPLFVTWNTDEPSYFNKVEYGKGKAYDNVVSQDFYYTNLTNIPVPALAITLDKSGTYHYKVTSCDMYRNCATSEGYKIKA